MKTLDQKDLLVTLQRKLNLKGTRIKPRQHRVLLTDEGEALVPLSVFEFRGLVAHSPATPTNFYSQFCPRRYKSGRQKSLYHYSCELSSKQVVAGVSRQASLLAKKRRDYIQRLFKQNSIEVAVNLKATPPEPPKNLLERSRRFVKRKKPTSLRREEDELSPWGGQDFS